MTSPSRTASPSAVGSDSRVTGAPGPDGAAPHSAPASAEATPIEREGARVLFLDDCGRLLVVRGHDPHDPGREFWFTPGGGLEPGESARAAAVRELAEETGYVLEPEELVGPVWRRTAIFDFLSRPYTQHEEFFVGRVADAERRERTDAEWTAMEVETIDEVSWMAQPDLRDAPIEVFPVQLRESWDEFTRWNGVTRDMGEVDE